VSSIIEGYNYDIFISYRQKDNKYNGWVTEFVDNLKKELEATFKEEISVYFDINPHDGLLETHDVDASLKEKLKCLVFIPIISRTYCDPKSFAWEHEFKAFVEQASQDKLGLKVKLPNGNVASRVLPIRIHDLDSEDVKVCESVLGGVLRGVEFIYKEPGVNRSLLPKDFDGKNLNNTAYRNQINKVALAIKEIITGLLTEPSEDLKVKVQPRKTIEEVIGGERILKHPKSPIFSLHKLIYVVLISTVLAITAIHFYPKIFKHNTLDDLRSSEGRISVAVMPFQNMTMDTVWNVWQDGIQNNLIAYLSNSEELKVRQIESITGLLQSKGLTNYASISPSIASIISQKLDANVFIYGSINQAGATIRLHARLIDSQTEEVFKSFQIDGTAENVLSIIDSLSLRITNFLIISKLGKGVNPEMRHLASTNSPEAYRYFIYGNNAFMKKDYLSAIRLFSQAIVEDSNFTFATLSLSIAYGNLGMYEEAKVWCLKAYKKMDQMPVWQKAWINWVYAIFFETPREEIKYLKQLQVIDDQYSNPYSNAGYCYNVLHQYDKAIPEMEKVLELYKKWGSKPSWVYDYTLLGYAFHKTGQLKKEKILYKKAEKDYPEDPDLISMQAILSLTKGDTIRANRYIEKYKSLLTDKSSSEADIKTGLASIYSDACILDKAEKYYRKALLSEPENPIRFYNLSLFLIDKDINAAEGLELIDKALGLSPDTYYLLATKGWGLYKLGKYNEALEILEKAWSLKPIYDHEIYLHLEEAKKVVAGQKNN
jgi:tetratricopeptide (TPR) repeat protein